MRRIALTAALVVAAATGVAYFALEPRAIPTRSSDPLDLVRLRALADSLPGEAPDRVHFLILADSTKPMAGVLGGFRFDRYVMVWTAFQIVAGPTSFIVDAPPDPDFHRANSPGDAYVAGAFETLQAALRHARAILLTHEHPDHVGGLARSPHLGDLQARLLLTREQLDSRSWLESVALPQDVRERLQPLTYEGYHPVARGLVLIKSPGHTPGSQMIYVKTRTGTEYLLIGDIAWHRDHLERPAGRPRISAWILEENAEAVAQQIAALHELARTEGVVLVPSHDRQLLEELAARGHLRAGFD